mgnify:CR=1 FL=1
MGTHVFHFFLDVDTTPLLCPLERKMLQEVRHAIVCIIFISTSCVNKNTHRACFPIPSLKTTPISTFYLR